MRTAAICVSAELLLTASSALSPYPMLFAAISSNTAECGSWSIVDGTAGLATITQRNTPFSPLIVRECDPFPAAQVILHESGDVCSSFINTSAQLSIAASPAFCLGVREGGTSVGVYKCDDPAAATLKWEYDGDDGTVWARARDGVGRSACLFTRTWAHPPSNYSSSREK